MAEQQGQYGPELEARVIIGPDGKMVLARRGETDAQAIQRQRTQPQLIPGANKSNESFPLRPALGLLGDAATLGAGLIPGVGPGATAIRALLTGGLGAGTAAIQGRDPVMGAAMNTIPEMALGRIASKGAEAGTRMGLATSRLNQTAPERERTVKAFMDEAARSRAEGRPPIRVGEQGVPEARMEDVGAAMRGKEQQSPFRPTAADIAGSAETLATRQGTTAAERTRRALVAAERKDLADVIYTQGREIYDHLGIKMEDFLDLPDDELLKWAQSTDMPAEMFGDIVRSSKNKGREAIRARQAGEFLGPEEGAVRIQLPAEQARRGQNVLKENIPGLSEDLKRYSDLALLEDVNNRIHFGLGQRSVQAGMTGAQGGLLFGRPGGIFGGLAGMALGPRAVSGIGHWAARRAEPRALSPLNILREYILARDAMKAGQEYKDSDREPEPEAPRPVGLRRR